LSPGSEKEQQLSRLRAAEAVARFAHSIATQIELPNIFDEAVARTRELCDADSASLLLVDRSTGDLRLDTMHGQHPELEDASSQCGQEMAARVSREAKPHLTPESAAGSIIAVPLLAVGDIIGVLQAIRGLGRVPFTSDDLQHLSDLGPHVANAVRNSQMRTELREMNAQVLAANSDLERKVSERTLQLARAKTEWEKTFDAISEPIALQDGFLIRRANLAYAKQVGLPITQIPGKTCHEILAKRAAPCCGCPLAEPKSRSLTAEIDIQGQSIFKLSGFRMSEQLTEAGFVMHYRNITSERLLEKRVREAERLAALGQLASGAAHEINNPLGFVASNLHSLRSQVAVLQKVRDSILGVLDQLGSANPEAAPVALSRVVQAELPGVIAAQSEMIEDSVDGVQRVARIVSALRELARQEVDVAEPCSVNASITRMVAAELGAGAQAEIELSGDGLARISPLQMDRVLEQLLRNARQATLGKQLIRIRSRSTRSEIVVEIQDQGPGISPEDLGHVFEPFFTKRQIGQGVGLGLTMVHEIVRRHEGTVLVESQAGQGTTVTVKLPRVAGIEEELRDCAPETLRTIRPLRAPRQAETS
jgi:signal transduction histidine kinase